MAIHRYTYHVYTDVRLCSLTQRSVLHYVTFLKSQGLPLPANQKKKKNYQAAGKGNWGGGRGGDRIGSPRGFTSSFTTTTLQDFQRHD